ncbi:MAG TPA: glycosyltransferase family 2 protein [Candidatus Acidoferrales bacterium]|nr:glycosyltransferase family 2 protein [Candidatus Acidoferrales bacterium]
MMKRRVSVVIPVHNEAENLVALVERLQNVAAELKFWEMDILFVDDGSTDASVQTLREIRANGIPIGYVRLSKNFGHQAALCAGMEHVTGDAIVTMDADLQHPPEEIPCMIEAHERGADVVQMVRSDSVGAGKGLFSVWFYRAFNRLSHTQIVPNAADFRLISRPVADVFLRIPEREKFVRGLIPSLGFHQTSLAFKQGDRLYGTPKYSFRTSLRLAQKALFDYSTVPLQFVFWFGIVMSIVSFGFGTGHFVWKLLHWNRVVPGFTDIITAIFFLSGCILASLGIVGRYMMMILEQVRRRPPFVVMDRAPGAPIDPSRIEPVPAEQIAITTDV